MTPKARKLIFFTMLLMVGIIGVLHSVTPGYMILYHDTYRRLSYFPIAIGAIVYGVRGGMILSILSCLAFVPHLYTFWAEGPQAYYSELSEILFYLAAGLVIGLISSRENRLKKKYRDLSEKLARSYDRLSGQASRLLEAEKQLGESRKLSILGHVSASFAHEIKNPLASVKGAAEILADEVGPDHPKHEFVDIMRTEISRLNTSVEKVLDYCRGNQPKRQFEFKKIKQVIDHVLSLMAERVKEKSIRIDVRYKDGADTCDIQEAPMIQVLLNILINAADAVEPDGMILIEVETDDNENILRILDDGPGIDETIKEDVFHSFVTYKDGGTGIGLSISKKIVDSLGGRISIERSKLGGAGIIICLPVKRPLIQES